MIILVTWRRIMLLHGDAGRRGNPSLATRGNSYGAVEWEVDFRLVVWLEANTREGGRGDQDQASRTSTSTQEQVRAGVEGGESDDDGGGSGPCVLVYHVPDLLGDICSESRDRRTGEADDYRFCMVSGWRWWETFLRGRRVGERFVPYFTS